MVAHIRSDAGFTLIELLIVISIMGVLAGMMLPSFSPSIHEQLQSVAQILATDLAYGRSLAIANNSKYRVRFEQMPNRYILEHSGTNTSLNNLPVTAFHTPQSAATQHTVDLDELPRVGPGVKIAAVLAVDTTSQSVTDLEFGSAGETTRSEKTVIWLAAGRGTGRRLLPVEVNPVTGLATVGTYTGTGPSEAAEVITP